LRSLLVLGFENHEPERFLERLGRSPRKDDFPARGGVLQVLEMPPDRGPVVLGPRALRLEPRREPQDVDPGQNVSRAAPSPSVNVFG
jgi:hypothetical protein